MRTLIHLRRLAWSLVVVVLLLTALGYLLSLAWREFGPRKPEPNGVRKQLATEWVRNAIQDIRTNHVGFTKAALFHFANDPTDFITDSLRGALDDSGYLHLKGPQLNEKAERLLNLEVSSPPSLEEAFNLARRTGVELIVFGRVLAYEGTQEGAKLIVEMKLGDPSTREVAFERTYVNVWQPSPLEPAVLRDGASGWRGPQRLLAWCLGILLLPIFTIQFLRTVVRRESNSANLSALTLYTAIDTVLAFLLLNITTLTLGGALILFTLIGAAGFYNLLIMSFALRLES